MFDRAARGPDAAQKVLGVGHRLMDRALEQARVGAGSVTVLPTEDLAHPLLAFRVTDQVTTGTGTVRAVVLGLEHTSAEEDVLLRAGSFFSV